jgi:hypothetical protein
LGIHLVRIDHSKTSDPPQVDPWKLSGNTYVDDSRLIADMVLVDGFYVLEYLNDGDGPLLEDD